MGYEFQSESLQAIRTEIEPLLALHKDEVGPYTDWKLEPAWDYYALLEQQNRLVTHTVRRDTALVGYVLYTVGRNNHYASQKIASVDVLFLRPDCRRSGAAMALLRWSQARLFADGVTCIQQRTKVRPSLYLGRLFARLGFQRADETWLIRADGVHVRHDPDQGKMVVTHAPLPPLQDAPAIAFTMTPYPGFRLVVLPSGKVYHGPIEEREDAKPSDEIERLAKQARLEKAIYPALPTPEGQAVYDALTRQDAPDFHPHELPGD